MRFSYDFLQSFFKEKLPSPEKLGALLTMHFFEVEEIKKEDGDIALEIDVLPNRAGDCFSHAGIAKEIAALTGLKYKDPFSKITESKEKISDYVTAEVKWGCNRYMLRGVQGVNVQSSPQYIKKRLKTCGITPVNNIVDILNYVMLETGQPLHGFDGEKISGRKITVRKAKRRERIVALDEKRYELTEDMLIIADDINPLAIAGVKGGIVPEVESSTKLVFLEGANFYPQKIRETSRKLGIRTDASLRFEHGLSAEFVKQALDRAVYLILEIADGKALKGSIDYYPQEEEIRKVTLDTGEIEKVLGVRIPVKTTETILRRLGFKIKKNKKLLYLEIPFFRRDIGIKEDVIEEIGRIYGYDNIKPAPPQEKIASSPGNENIDFEQNSRDFWCSVGFSENYNYTFLSEKKAGFAEKEQLPEVEKPVSLEFKYLRPSLLPGLIFSAGENEKYYGQIRIFETGKVFRLEGEKAEENKMLASLISPADFYKLKGETELFLERILVKNAEFIPVKDHPIISELRGAEIIVEGERVGFLGDIESEAQKKAEIKKGATVMEIDLEKLQKFAEKKKTYKPLSRFPLATRDLAVLVPDKTLYGTVVKEIEKHGGVALQNIILFDTYTGSEIPKGKKNFAFRLTYGSQKKTLSSTEVNKLHQKVMDAVDGIREWKVRK